ncbi:hypothetical protein [Streptosporangium roseum]|uniref:hypothetical protein n=1 Tax=Streptosporangium roseum TaxID=2001 RepID=UPI00332A6D6D
MPAVTLWILLRRTDHEPVVGLLSLFSQALASADALLQESAATWAVVACDVSDAWAAVTGRAMAAATSRGGGHDADTAKIQDLPFANSMIN